MRAIRPNPDVLLKKIQRDTEQEKRGHLKIFFGGCAGVGKTYSMLRAAHDQQKEGIDVLVGFVETHGRLETKKLVEGLKQLEPKSYVYRNKNFVEFDLESALLRNPQLILVDELAHSNVSGTRHQKRWQDVEELLSAGIDVYTTLNVQHLETLNDVVSQITGISVSETIPDYIFDHADEVILVDLPPDELLERLEEGKIYFSDQAERAAHNFFKKGNLIALRELALRRTADRVDADMRDYRSEQHIQAVWRARECLLVCVGSSADSENLVRSAARLANGLRAVWRVVYVETPALQKQNAYQRRRILNVLNLAQSLGAEAVTLSGNDIAETLIAYARSFNVSKLVMGFPKRGIWRHFFSHNIGDRIADRASDMDICLLQAEKHRESIQESLQLQTEKRVNWFAEIRAKRAGYLWAVIGCVLITGLAIFLSNIFAIANEVALYLLGIVIISLRYGLGPGMASAVLSVLAFDFFLVPPIDSFRVTDAQYILTLLIFCGVSLTISRLMADVRYQMHVAILRERRTHALYAAGRELSTALTVPQAIEMSVRYFRSVLQAEVSVLLPNTQETVSLVGESMCVVDAAIAQWVFDHALPAGLGTQTLSAADAFYFPLTASTRTHGVLVLKPMDVLLFFKPEQQQLLAALAMQLISALERMDQ